MPIRYTRNEENLNVWSHAAGIVLGVVVGVVFLVMCAGKGYGWARAGVILYLVGMLGSYISSTVYHALPRRSKWKERLRRWDHAAIYWHIAGSYSPITLVALREVGFWGWGLFIFVWTCAVVGTVVSFVHLKEHSHIETFSGGVLYHRCRVLQFEQAALYAQCFPFLCSGRLGVPHHRRVGLAQNRHLTCNCKSVFEERSICW